MQVNSNQVDALVLFSGPGGSSLGLRQAGVRRTLGIEYNPSHKGTGVQPAVATARAAGLDTMQEDVRLLDPRIVAATFSNQYRADLLIQASPPCQGLSMAGKGAGREDLELLLQALRLVAQLPIAQAAAWTRWYTQQLAERCSDDRSPLTFEVVRWIAGLNPEYVMLEQVPAALPIWRAIGEVLRGWGYSVWAGNVQAEQFGVPQTRKRAMLMASRVSEVEAPVPTHSKYHNRNPAKLDLGVAKWVSMAEALGWGLVQLPSFTVMAGPNGKQSGAEWGGKSVRDLMYGMIESGSPEWRPKDLVGFPRRHDGRGDAIVLSGEEYRARDLRTADRPAFVVTEKARSWSRFPGDEPREPVPAIEGETADDCQWVHDCPSPTIVGSFAPDVVAKRGYRKAGDPPRQRTPGSVRVTVVEAGVLQAFPIDFPWQGSRTAQYTQVGNAVPPLLQQALTSSLLAHRDTWSQPVSQTA